jgi:hypothetical protein
MARVKWGIGGDEPEEMETFNVYDGPVPPGGVYRFKLRRLQIVTNRNGDDMMKWVMDIQEPKGSDKARFNGYGVWGQQNITDQGKPFLKNLLIHGLGVSWSDFMNKTITVDEERPTMVKSIGRKKFLDETIDVRAQCKRETYQGEPRLAFGRMLPWEDAEEEMDEGDEPDKDDVF